MAQANDDSTTSRLPQVYVAKGDDTTSVPSKLGPFSVVTHKSFHPPILHGETLHRTRALPLGREILKGNPAQDQHTTSVQGNPAQNPFECLICVLSRRC